MCGLFGMMGHGVIHEDLTFLRQLAYISGLRGIDGTGILQANVSKKKKDFTMEKMGSEVSYFTWFHEFDKGGNKRLLNTVQDNIFMGHVRAATKGAINGANAHPFDVGRYVGAHNGTLRDKKYEHKTKTDSELFFQDIERRGLKTVLEDLDKDSAYAVTMYDKEEGTIIFAKNDKRPLHFAYNTKRSVVYWASEKLMLEFILKRIDVDYGLIYKFTDNRIYTLHPNNITMGVMPRWMKTEDLETKKVVEEQKAPLITHMNQNRENLSHLLIQDQSKVVPLNLNLRNRQKGKKRLLEHCVYCQRNMDPLDQYKGSQMDEGLWVCESCDEINSSLMKEHLEKHSPINASKGIMH